MTAFALAGTLVFNPLTDTLVNEKGETVKLDEPKGRELPTNGFEKGEDGYIAPAEDGSNVEVKVDPTSDRLQILAPFTAPVLEKDFNNLRVLIKTKNKCTTDHISMAGP